jgi:hypothetical protein
MSRSTPDQPEVATSVAPPSSKRRRFLFALGASGAGAAAAVAAPGVTATVAPAAVAAPKGRPGGYRETEHVRDYYDTTRR